MARKILNGADLNGQRIQNLGDASSPSDAVTKAQLDAMARGLDWKQSVRAATTANITLSGAQSIDGVSVVAGDRVLVKDQSSGATNGIYVAASGSWARANDFDSDAEVTAALAVPVEQGTANGDKAFILTTDGPIVVGTTALVFSELGGGNITYTAGDGLDLVGTVFSTDLKSGSGLVIDAGEVSLDIPTLKALLGIAGKFSQNVPTNATAVITHNLGTTDVLVAVFEVATGVEVEPDVARTDANTVTLTFASAPSSGQYRVVVMG